MDKYVFKTGENGQMDSYFIVEVYNNNKRISKVEKTYGEFENFKSELDFSLRGANLKVPALNDNLLDSLLPTTDSLFR